MIFVFAIAFVVVWGILIYYLFQSIAIWRKNNRSPKIIELATVVAKRKRIVHHQNFDVNKHHVLYNVSDEKWK